MQDDNGKAPPIIGSNRLTVLKPEMSSSPFKYDPLFQSGGENSVFENINNSQPRTNMKKKQPPPPQPSPPKSCVPGTAAKVPPRTATWKPRSSLYFFFFPSLTRSGFRAILKKTLRPPLSSSLETKQIEFRSFDWLQRADLANVCLPSCEPEVVTSEESPDAPISALKWDRQVLRGCLLTFFPHPTLLQNTESVKNLMPPPLLLCGGRSVGGLIIPSQKIHLFCRIVVIPPLTGGIFEYFWLRRA